MNDNLLTNKRVAEEWLNHQLRIHPPINQLVLEDQKEPTRSGGRRARRYGGGEEEGAQRLSLGFNLT
jgi:hypothetical protein